MDTVLSIEIAYNKTILLKQLHLRRSLSVKPYYKGARKLFFISLGLILFGLIVGNGKEIVNFYSIVGFVVGCVFLSTLFTLLISNRNLKKQEKELIPNELPSEARSLYEFSDKSIKYSTVGRKIEYDWTVLAGFTIVKDTIFILMTTNVEYAFILSKEEMLANEFAKLQDLLSQKLKRIEL